MKGLSVHNNLQFCLVNAENVRGVEVRTSYAGCMRNIRLNQNPVSFEDASVFGPINTGECPTE